MPLGTRSLTCAVTAANLYYAQPLLGRGARSVGSGGPPPRVSGPPEHFWAELARKNIATARSIAQKGAG